MTALNTSTGGGATAGAYLQLLRRRKWVVLAALLIAPAVAYAVTSRQATHYQASADVLLLASTTTNSTDPLANIATLDSPDTLTTLARSTPVARLAIANGHLGMSPDTFLAETGMFFSPDGDIATFTATTPDPAPTPRVANAYAHAFVRYRYSSETSGLKEIEKTLEARLAATSKGAGRSALSQQLAVVEAELAVHVADARVLQSATTAAAVRPPTKRNVVLGVVLGLVLGLGLAFLLDALDTRVRTIEAVEERLGLSVLARLPEPSKSLRQAGALAMVEEPMGRSSEAFRMLRTNLEFAMLDRDIRTVMITSAWEGEGKSTTIANLAVAFARVGRPVTLVDLDLRQPMLHRFFPVGDRPGLADVVLGYATLDQALARFDFRSDDFVGSRNGSEGYGWPVSGERPAPLSVLALGIAPPNPGEFVASRPVANLLEMLRERDELVLIDAPPLFHVGDGLALSAQVDAIILAVKLDIARRPELTRLHSMLEAIPAHPLGVVVTGAGAGERHYGYGYGYGYGSGEYPSKRRLGSKEAAST